MDADSSDYRRVAANAARLLLDAELLAENSRCASAFALAVLAMEEVGKLVLTRWSKSAPLANGRRLTFHIRKQTAVAHLLAAPMIIDEIRKNNFKTSDGEAAVEKLAKTIYESGEGRWMRHADLGVLERIKHLSLYSDLQFEELGLGPEDFDSADVNRMRDRVTRAMALLTNGLAMTIARATYVEWLSPNR
jgi:AbiV family abortive infection protein